MSMSGWDVASVSDNGTFNPSIDQSVAFAHTPTSSTFEYNQLQNAQLQQRMQNGAIRNGSPGFQTPQYQTTSVIPSKRSHGDVYAASPRQTSRSQTPQQVPYPGYAGGINGQPAPTAYQHLQQTNNNAASPSPIMQNQHYNPQRMQTASPSPFSPTGQNYPAQQGSPAPSDYGSRVDTPQNGVPTYLQGAPYGGPQGFTPPPGGAGPMTPGNGPSSHPQAPANLQQQQQQREHEMRQQQLRQQQAIRQLAATNSAAQQRHQMGSLNPMAGNPTAGNPMAGNPMAGNPNPMAAYHQAARAQQMQQAMMRPPNPETFLRMVTQFMQSKGLIFNPNPVIANRPVSPHQIYAVVMKQGGSKKITAANAWQTIAMNLQLPPMAAHELQTYWQGNLAHYEHNLYQNFHQQHRVQQQRMALSQGAMMQPSPGDRDAGQDQSSPMKQVHHQNQEQAAAMMNARRQPSMDFQTPVRQMQTPQHNPRQMQMNGHSMPQQSSAANLLHMPPQPSPSQGQPAISPHENVGGLMYPGSGHPHDPAPKNSRLPQHHPPASTEWMPTVVTPGFLGRMSWGGIQIDPNNTTVRDLERFRPTVPEPKELGIVSIRALNMSLKSGIRAEVRNALDTLVSLSRAIKDTRASYLVLELEDCEDLVETIIECAEEQVELLAENSPEVSDDMLISPYEDVVRGCRTEMKSLLDTSEFGTLEYTLDRAVEKLICITTILRNFSFAERNHAQLADPAVVKFLATMIRYLGTRNMLLRTHQNTLLFAKNIVVYLSNVSCSIDLPGKEEALCILHFLLSFLPSPPPTTPGSEEVMFTPFDPFMHQYLPPAVDSLAKLLARDDPNRTFYKSIFASDACSSPPYDTLTRTFALAIAPVPDFTRCSMETIDGHKPSLMQGLLAAEIIVSFIPTNEHLLARSWLASQDGFALTLLRLVSILKPKPLPEEQHDHPVNGDNVLMSPDMMRDNAMVINHSLSVLRKLAERARDGDAPTISLSGLPYGVLPKNRMLLDALTVHYRNSNMVRALCASAGLRT